MKALDKIAVIRLKGQIRVPYSVRRTMELLRLNRVNQVTIIDNSKQYVGMLRKANTHLTWGEVDRETVKKLLLKRAYLEGKRKINQQTLSKYSIYDNLDDFLNDFFNSKARLDDIKTLKLPFRLTPPKKGHEGVKKHFGQGGAMGYRGENINNLILRMI